MNELYKIDKVNDHIYRIIGVTNEFAYLIIGKEKALLIDTCCGVKGIREVVDSLTDLDYEVVLTHGHVDHCGGIGQFRDKVIYLDKNDFSVCKTQRRKLLIKLYVKNAENLYKLKYGKKQFDISNNSKVKLTELKEETNFALGGINVINIPLYGHSKGSNTFLIKEDRILLLSDACNPSTFLFLPGSLTVEEYRNNLLDYLSKVDGKYDEVILSHIPCICDKNEVKQMIDLCDEILAGAEPQQRIKIMFKNVKVAHKIDEKTGFSKDPYKANLLYNKIR